MDKQETNERLYSLFTESIWFEDKDIAKRSFIDLIDEVNKLSVIPTQYDFYDDFARSTRSELKAVQDLSNAILLKLMINEWRSPNTSMKMWEDAYMSTDTHSETFSDCNIITASITDTGEKGGDAGHGCIVRLSIKDDASTCMFLNGVEADHVEIEVHGDSERRTLLNALKFFVSVMESR